MANTLTPLIPELYEALDIVSRELVGFIPAVNRSSNAERAAVGQEVGVPVVPDENASDITPGQTAPDEGDTEVTTRPIKITQARKVPIRFTGEETRGLQTSDTYSTVRRDRFAQGMRTLTNEVEGDLGSLATEAGHSYGESGKTPFGTKDDLSDFAGVNRELDQAGAPQTGRQLVAGSNAFFNLRGKQTGILQKVNEAGTAAALRSGIFGDVHNLTLRNSAQTVRHSTDTSDGFSTSSAASEGDTEIEVSGGTGGIQKGDTVTIAGEQYVIEKGINGSSGTINLAEPGLEADVASGTDLTSGDTYEANLGFHRNAIQLATRTPALPEGGDSADDRRVVQDPVSGLAFEVAMYRQYRQLYMEVAMVWGFAMTKPEHACILRG